MSEYQPTAGAGRSGESDEWALPPVFPVLAASAVHVWRVRLDQPEGLLSRLYATLAAGEQARARRFRFAEHRRHFIGCRGTLRAILAAYLGGEADRLSIAYGRHGKPYLVPSGDRTVQFNLSHTGGLALVAVAWTARLGIDLEAVRADLRLDEVARAAFSDQEYEALQAFPADHRLDAFFVGWTRKEAYCKATGEGFSRSPAGFTVSLDPGRPALLAAGDDWPEQGPLTFHNLFPGSGFRATLVVEGECSEIRCLQWPP